MKREREVSKKRRERGTKIYSKWYARDAWNRDEMWGEKKKKKMK